MYDSSSDYLHDRWFKNNVLIIYNNAQYTGADGNIYQSDMGFIRHNFSPASAQGSKVCHTAVTVITENADNLEYMQLLQYNNDDGSGEYSGFTSPNDLRRIDLNKIDKLCNQCSDYEVCGLLVAWK